MDGGLFWFSAEQWEKIVPMRQSCTISKTPDLTRQCRNTIFAQWNGGR